MANEDGKPLTFAEARRKFASAFKDIPDPKPKPSGAEPPSSPDKCKATENMKP